MSSARCFDLRSTIQRKAKFLWSQLTKSKKKNIFTKKNDTKTIQCRSRKSREQENLMKDRGRGRIANANGESYNKCRPPCGAQTQHNRNRTGPLAYVH
ncbi:hypothetical protein PUN28_002210 [Cardiocondyla obscurior]|uniref:Uncharacterized protein n=1 Tax=Cardiocondyla obscurior TaxID=286306 RepID=A0AAW2GT11_9HYME